jgi:hypothetical protein
MSSNPFSGFPRWWLGIAAQLNDIPFVRVLSVRCHGDVLLSAGFTCGHKFTAPTCLGQYHRIDTVSAMQCS